MSNLDQGSFNIKNPKQHDRTCKFEDPASPKSWFNEVKLHSKTERQNRMYSARLALRFLSFSESLSSSVWSPAWPFSPSLATCSFASRKGWEGGGIVDAPVFWYGGSAGFAGLRA